MAPKVLLKREDGASIARKDASLLAREHSTGPRRSSPCIV